MNNNNVLVYLHKVEYDADKIKAAVDIIDHFKATMDNSGRAIGETLSIDKDLLDEINKDYQMFVANKLSHIKTIKDCNQKLISQVEEFKLPNLEQYLCKLYASSSSKNDICEYCGYAAKNTRALVAHYRGCSQKKQHTPLLTNTMNQTN
jgi:predicted alpha/beta-fold hydrolase